MLQYVNGFLGICNEEKESLILKFVQNDPSKVNQDGELDFETHEIASMIMDYDCAFELVKYLAGVLADKIELDDIVEDGEEE